VCHDSLQKYQFSEAKPSQSHFWEPPSFCRQLIVHIVNHTLLLIRSVSRFCTQNISSVRSKPHSRTFENHGVCSRQLPWLVRIVNHTLLLMRSVSQFSTQRSVLWGKTLTVALLRISELFPAVTRAHSKSHTTPDTECVTILCTISVQWGKTLTHTLLRTFEFVSTVTLVRSKSHTTPNTECVKILYKTSVQWGKTLTVALLRTTEFVLGSYSCA